MASSWSDLPQALLGLIAARLPFPKDRARFRAVCRSCRSALRDHHVQTRQLIVQLLEDRFMTPSDGRSHPLPSFPDNASCIGSTDGWLALRSDDANGQHHYSLHNPFSKATVPLTALDTIIDRSRQVRKVLVRSTTEDDLIVAVMTNSRKRPFILLSCGGNNSAWFPGPRDLVYYVIIDISFLEGKLYAITQDEDLFPIDIGSDGEGKLMVARGRRTIRQPPSNSSYLGWSESEDENADEEEGAALLDDDEEAASEDEDHGDNEEGEAGASYENNDDNEERDDDDDEGEWEEEEPYEEGEWEEEEPYEDALPDTRFEYVRDDAPHGNEVFVVIVRYLVESRGRLVLVRQHIQLTQTTQLTRRVEVFEAGAGAWVPMTNGLGGGQALFVGMCVSKSGSAPCAGIEEDTICFANTGEVFDMRSQACSPARWFIPIPFGTWFFPPDLVV